MLQVNLALCNLTRYSETDLLERTSPQITHPDDRAETIVGLQALVDGEATEWSTDKRYVTATGEDVWVHFAVSVIRDADGRPSYGVSQVEDITDRKHAEAQLAERSNELASNVDRGRAAPQRRARFRATAGTRPADPTQDEAVAHILRGVVTS